MVKTYVLRSIVDGIISEFVPVESSNTTVILLDGLPSNVSTKRDVLLTLSSLGYSGIAPRYKGTWESEGEFLDHNPAQDIKHIINMIRNGEFIDLYNNISYNLPSESIIVIGVSFGGIVALDILKELGENDKCVLVSPLCDMLKFKHDLPVMREFVKKGYGRAYNYTLENWDKMLKGELFITDYELIKENSEKISLIYDENDQSIQEGDLLDFCDECGIKNMKKVDGYGHISYSKWDDNIYQILKNIIGG